MSLKTLFEENRFGKSRNAPTKNNRITIADLIFQVESVLPVINIIMNSWIIDEIMQTFWDSGFSKVVVFFATQWVVQKQFEQQ